MSLEANYPGRPDCQTTCEILCPRVVLRKEAVRRFNEGATLPNVNRDTRGHVLGQAAQAITAAVASVPANIKAAWTCPERDQNPESWEPTAACVEAAREMGPRFVCEGVQVTGRQAQILEAAGVPFYYPPRIVDQQ